MLRARSGAIALYCLALMTAPVLAQGAEYSGMWACQSAYDEFDQSGNRTGGFVREYMIALYPNQTFEAQGTRGDMNGYHPFQSQGNWYLEADRLMVQGPELSATSQIVPTSFVMIGQILQNGAMAFTYEQPDSAQRYIMSRSNYLCERSQ